VAGQTIEVALGDPGPSATFKIPPRLVPFVDAVFARIDNSAGADTTPTLEVEAPNGDTVAAVPQDDVVPGGDVGRVTWALRLPGKRGGGGRGTKQITVYTQATTWPDSGPPLNNGAWTNAFPYDSSVFNFANTAGAAVEILAPGKYLLWLTVEWDLTLWGTNVWVAIGGDANNFGVVSANGSNAVGVSPGFQARPPALWFAYIAIVPTGTTFPLEVFMDGFQASGAGRPQQAQLMVWQLDPTPTP
jgi:hypothetical protein